MNASGDELPLSALRRIDDVCQRFEAAWHSCTSPDDRPRIERYLAGAEGREGTELLGELIRIDLHHRRRSGDAPSPDHYATRFPGFDLRWLDNDRETEPPRTVVGGGTELPSVAGYEILGVLGRGGMGVVYRARHLALDRVVALKMISPRILGPGAARRFLREMRAASRLAHPHIVTVHDAGGEEEPYFTMEHLEGADLSEIVRRRGRLPVAEACEYVRQAALGLQHALDRGLIHRDIKPGNLFVTNDGVVKVLDLGLARFVGGQAGAVAMSSLTEEGTILGTPDYVAPEQLVDAASADTRADLYSLGCTLYHLLAGCPPFANGSAAEKIAKHMSAEPPPLKRLRPDVPPAVAAIVRRLLAKRPEDRYQTPAALAAAFEKVEAPISRRWALVALPLLLVGLIAWGAWPAPTPPANVAPPDVGQTPSIEHDRRAAEIFLAHGMSVGIHLVGREFRTVKPGEPLPTGPFEVRRITTDYGALYEPDFVRNVFLPAVADLEHLDHIEDFAGRMVWTEATLAGLADSPAGASLRKFQSWVPLTAGSLEVLKRFPRLTGLQADASQAGDALLSRLGELPNLIFLRLDDLGASAEFSAKGWAAIASLRVPKFSLHTPRGFDNEVAALVAGMPELDDFWVWTKLPIDGLVPTLLRAPKLRELGLNSTLTDAGLRHLREGKNLQQLYIHGNPVVTEAGAVALSEALPKCRINWDGGTFEPRSK